MGDIPMLDFVKELSVEEVKEVKVDEPDESVETG
jgi:hypothetical protein